MKSSCLSEFIKIRNGRDHKVLADGSYPVYGSGGVMRFVDKYLYDKPSILLPRKGSIDHIQFANTPFGAVDTTYYTEVDENKVDIYYLYCLLSRLDLSGFRTGTGVPSMTFDSYYNVKVSVPDLPDQRKIGKFLSSVDRLIELSRKRIENLEKLAKEIYDYWFVQFDFPDKNGKPYKSSGGKMVYNVTLKREIPAGWKAQSLPEVLNLTMGQSPDGKSYNEAGAGTLFYQGATDFGCTFPSPRQYTTSPSRMAGSGAVLMSVRAPVGTKNRVLDECCIGRGLCALFSENGGTSFAWYVAEYLKPYFDRKNNDGTTFGAVGKDEFSKLMILSPSEDVVKEFGKLVKPLDLAMVKAQRHIDLLVKAHEFLLPLLMNGQAKMR